MKNQQLEITPNAFFKTSRTLYFAILAGVAFVTVFFYMDLGKQEFKIDFKNNMFLLSIALGVLAILASNFMFKNLKDKISKNSDLRAKIGQLQTANLVRYAILEVPVFIIIFALSPDKSFFIIPVIILLYLLSLMPNKEKLEEDLNLTTEQKIQWNKGDEVIK